LSIENFISPYLATVGKVNLLVSAMTVKNYQNSQSVVLLSAKRLVS